MTLEVKIYVVASLLQELLDETSYDTRFKHKLRYDINNVQKNLDKMLSVNIETNELSLYLSRAGKALEDTLDGEE